MSQAHDPESDAEDAEPAAGPADEEETATPAGPADAEDAETAANPGEESPEIEEELVTEELRIDGICGVY